MRTEEVVALVKQRLSKVKPALQSHAPLNTKYVGLYNYKPVNFIFVDGKRVFGNTNNLYNSVQENIVEQGNGFVHRVSVSSSRVPYYQRAVLSQTLTRFFHYGRLDYGMGYAQSKVQRVINRNYKYYEKAYPTITSIVKGLTGTIEVTDDISRWE